MRTTTRSIALGGLFSALAILFLLVGGFISIGTYAAPVFAGACLLPIAMDVGRKWALLCYAAVSVLGFLLVPDIELVLFFVALLGYYPILRPTLNKLTSRPLRALAKLGLFNAALAAVYALMLFVFASDGLRQALAEHAPWFWALMLLAGNLTFLLYDLSLKYIIIVYCQRIRPHLFRR